MSTLRHVLAGGAMMLAASATADAQLRRTTTGIPDASTLPRGMCQVWIDGIPADRQPAATDCASARRNQPRNSRIVYGSRPTNVYGNRDPRSIPGTPQYDPRFDPRSSQYDPRLDPHANRSDRDRWERERADRERNRDREEWRRKQERERLEYQRKQAREREKYLKKQEKEREKEWKKANKGNNGNRGERGRDRDRDDDDDDRRYGDRDGRYGTVRQDCVDVNRDGRCDSRQPGVQTYPNRIPQSTPQTLPPAGTRRVCVDANRDGRCDDGGPLVRTATP